MSYIKRSNRSNAKMIVSKRILDSALANGAT